MPNKQAMKRRLEGYFNQAVLQIDQISGCDNLFVAFFSANSPKNLPNVWMRKKFVGEDERTLASDGDASKVRCGVSASYKTGAQPASLQKWFECLNSPPGFSVVSASALRRVSSA